MPKPTVLIVDDDQEVTQYLREVFKGDGWKALTEKEGDWALKTFKSRRIDAVILDILIPVLNGFQVAEAIRNDPRGKEVPIVIMSGIYRGAENRQEAIERYGLLEYLNKPVEGERVRRLLRAALTARETEQQRSRTGTRKRVTRKSERTARVARRESRRPARVAQALPREAVPLRGNLGQIPFARLLHELYRLQASGAVFLMRDKLKKIVYLDSGQPVFVKSNALRESLGQRLVQAGRLPPEQCEAAVQQARQAKRLLGGVLVEQGVLTEADLADALHDQLEAKLEDLFGWPQGEYQFKESAKLPQCTFRTRASCASLIVRGLGAHYDLARLEREVGPLLSSLAAPASDPYLRFQPFALPPGGDAVVEALDGSRRLMQVVEQQAARRELALHVALALYYAGVLELFDGKLALPPVCSEPQRLELHGPGSLPGPEDPGLEEYLAAELVKLKRQDHFRVLDLAPSATTAEVEAAFDARAWRVHPDRFVDRRSEVRELAEGLFNRLRGAYVVLRSPSRRESYLEQLGEPTGGSSGGATHEAVAEAKQHLAQGEAQLGEGRYEQAARSFREAVQRDERSTLAHAQLGWAVHKDNPTDPVATREAIRYLERALQLDPALDLAHQYLGHLYLAADDLDRARDHFQKALQANPDNADAAEQLEQL